MAVEKEALIEAQRQREILEEAKLLAEIKLKTDALKAEIAAHQGGAAIAGITVAAGNAHAATDVAQDAVEQEMKAVIKQAKDEALVQGLDAEKTRAKIREKIAAASQHDGNGILEAAATAGNTEHAGNHGRGHANNVDAARNVGIANGICAADNAAVVNALPLETDSNPLLDQALEIVRAREEAVRIGKKGGVALDAGEQATLATEMAVSLAAVKGSIAKHTGAVNPSANIADFDAANFGNHVEAARAESETEESRAAAAVKKASAPKAKKPEDLKTRIANDLDDDLRPVLNNPRVAEKDKHTFLEQISQGLDALSAGTDTRDAAIPMDTSARRAFSKITKRLESEGLIGKMDAATGVFLIPDQDALEDRLRPQYEQMGELQKAYEGLAKADASIGQRATTAVRNAVRFAPKVQAEQQKVESANKSLEGVEDNVSEKEMEAKRRRALGLGDVDDVREDKAERWNQNISMGAKGLMAIGLAILTVTICVAALSTGFGAAAIVPLLIAGGLTTGVGAATKAWNSYNPMKPEDFSRSSAGKDSAQYSEYEAELENSKGKKHERTKTKAESTLSAVKEASDAILIDGKDPQTGLMNAGADLEERMAENPALREVIKGSKLPSYGQLDGLSQAYRDFAAKSGAERVKTDLTKTMSGAKNYSGDRNHVHSLGSSEFTGKAR